MEDSCMSLHAPAMEPRGKVWPSSSSAPLPRLAASPLQQGSEAAPRAGGAAADALAEHMLLLDMDGDLGYDDADDACGAAEPPPQLLRPEQPPSPVPEGDDAPAAAAAAATAGSPGGSPVPSPGRGAAGGDDAAKSRSAPLAPTGFTPAESYIDRQERTVFFAKCAPSASVDAVARVFGAYGEIEEINLFRQWPSAKASRGCGLVVMSTPQGASAAIDALHRKFTWDGVSAPMVVERCCAARLGVKAATQQATRVRRTAAAAAARRAARGGGAGGGGGAAGAAAWHGSAPAGRPGSAPGHHGTGLGALSPVRYGAGAGAAGGLVHPAGLYSAAASAPLPMVSVPNAALALHAQLAAAPPQHAAAHHDPRAANSAPLPVLYGSYALPSGATAAAYHQPGAAGPGQHCASPLSTSPLTAVHYDPSALGMQIGMQCGMQAGVELQQAQLPDAGSAPCQVALQSPEQVQLVCSHAATLSALSGAAFWLAPAGGAGAAGTLALSGTPGQLQAATELIGQLLGAAGPAPGAGALGMGGGRWQ